VAGTSFRSLLIALAALGVAFLAAAVVVVLGVHSGSGRPSPEVGAGNTTAASRGQVIFRFGVDADGALIPRAQSQSGNGMMGRGMMGHGCATCHGIDGRGRSTMMYAAPDIAYGNLTDPKGMLMPDGTRGPTYSDAAIRRAVVTGIDPEGDHLEWPMPQWQLNDQEWSDLLTYMETLK
jgi:hypothetical protein